MQSQKINNLEIFKKAVGLSLVVFSVLSMVFIFFEPVMLKAATDNDEATVTATITEEVTISTPDNATFNASIPGVSGGNATASLSWNVKTSNSTGFSMTLAASQANALYQDGTYYFSDYDITPPLDYVWTSPTSGNAFFGFTVDSATTTTAINSAFLDNGSNTCGTGSTNGTDTCWSGFNGTTPVAVLATSGITGGQNGETVAIKFKADSNKILQEGNYTATVTATASTN